MVLRDVAAGRINTLVVAASTLLPRLAPTRYIGGYSISLAAGQKLRPEQLRLQLETAGYQRVSQVMEHGDFAVRGSLLDFYPMGSEQPVRIDFLDDEIESLREFDPDTQLSGAVIEVAGNPAGPRDAGRCRSHQAVPAGLPPPLRGQPGPFDHLSRGVGGTHARRHRELSAAVFRGNRTALGLPACRTTERFTGRTRCPARLRLAADRRATCAGRRKLRAAGTGSARDQRAPRKNIWRSWHADRCWYWMARADAARRQRCPPCRSTRAASTRPRQLGEFIRSFSGRILFAAESPGRREMLADILRQEKLPASRGSQLV